MVINGQNVGAGLYYCEKTDCVWEVVGEGVTNFVNDERYKYTVHIYKDFPHYGKARKKLPCKIDDNYGDNFVVRNDNSYHEMVENIKVKRRVK